MVLHQQTLPGTPVQTPSALKALHTMSRRTLDQNTSTMPPVTRSSSHSLRPCNPVATSLCRPSRSTASCPTSQSQHLNLSTMQLSRSLKVWLLSKSKARHCLLSKVMLCSSLETQLSSTIVLSTSQSSCSLGPDPRHWIPSSLPMALPGHSQSSLHMLKQYVVF